MKPITALIVATVVAATVTQPAAAKSRHDSDQSGWTNSGPDYTQSGPNHTGPLYRGYPMSDWYIY